MDVSLGGWVQWYTFDVIATITFSAPGFTEEGKNVMGITNAVAGQLAYNSVVRQSSTLHRLLLKGAGIHQCHKGDNLHNPVPGRTSIRWEADEWR